MNRLYVLLSVAVIIACGACSPGGPPGGAKYLAIHRSGLKILPYPRQVEALFGSTDHFITHYGQSGPLTWNSEVYFYGRYCLTVQVDVEVDYSSWTVVEEVAPPTFYLREYTKIRKTSEGVYGASIGKNWQFGRDEWNRLVAAKGDFHVIGLEIRSDEPLPDFDEYVHNVRRGRIPVDDGRDFVPIPK